MYGDPKSYGKGDQSIFWLAVQVRLGSFGFLLRVEVKPRSGAAAAYHAVPAGTHVSLEVFVWPHCWPRGRRFTKQNQRQPRLLQARLLIAPVDSKSFV
jgi:hypothetical protein